jgi:succinate dehydrogenase / fumarate reductase membrane anchor subunit
MVTSVSSLGRTGVFDWLVQRISAVVMLAWFVFLAAFLVTHPALTFLQWRNLFDFTLMRVFTLVTMVALCAHAWIGMWTISTDYLTAMVFGRAATLLRLLFQLATLTVLVVYLVWCTQILWRL